MPRTMGKPRVINIGNSPVKLAEQMEQISEVIVTATRPIVKVHPDKTVFNIEEYINVAGYSAMELLPKSPGVVVENNDNVMLQGRSGVIDIHRRQTLPVVI